jgi:hypothetical protein
MNKVKEDAMSRVASVLVKLKVILYRNYPFTLEQYTYAACNNQQFLEILFGESKRLRFFVTYVRVDTDLLRFAPSYETNTVACCDDQRLSITNKDESPFLLQ